MNYTVSIIQLGLTRNVYPSSSLPRLLLTSETGFNRRLVFLHRPHMCRPKAGGIDTRGEGSSSRTTAYSLADVCKYIFDEQMKVIYAGIMHTPTAAEF